MELHRLSTLLRMDVDHGWNSQYLRKSNLNTYYPAHIHTEVQLSQYLESDVFLPNERFQMPSSPVQYCCPFSRSGVCVTCCFLACLGQTGSVILESFPYFPPLLFLHLSPQRLHKTLYKTISASTLMVSS